MLANQKAAALAACVYRDKQQNWSACACVYTETNGRIGETLLHSRLSLLLIDMDVCRRAISLHTVYCHSTKENSF